MNRPIVRLAGSAFALAVATTTPAAAENVLRWSSVGSAGTIDPHGFDEGPTFAQLSQVYEGLLGFDSNLALVPRLAVTWRLAGPTTWEFELRRNARFHYGTPLTAADVVFSLARARTEFPGSLAGRIESIAAVRAVDDHTVHIETKFPDPQLWDKVRSIYVMSQRWAEAHDAAVPADCQRRRGELCVAPRQRHRRLHPAGVRGQRPGRNGPQPGLVGPRALSPQRRSDRVQPDRRPRRERRSAAPWRPRSVDQPALPGVGSDRERARPEA